MLKRILKASWIVFLIICVLLLGVRREGDIYAIECSNDYPLLNFTIVVDAGHGGQDGGAIGIKTLVREKDINLSIAKKVGKLFESVGATVVLTRDSDEALSKDGFSKMEDMRTRAEIIERAEPYIVISIHCNSFPQSKNVKGAQMFYYPGSETGKRLADCIQGSLKQYIDQDNRREPKSENFYMLRHGNSTSVMIECGFLSCPEEEQLLIDKAYQEKIAYCIFDGTSRYISLIRTPENI